MEIKKTLILVLLLTSGYSASDAFSPCVPDHAGIIRTVGSDSDTLDDFDLMIQKISADFSSVQTESQVRNLLSKIGADGSFNDIDYTDRSKTNWEPNTHLERMFNLAQTYANPGKFNGSEDIYNAIVNAAGYWVKLCPKSDNWWYNSIKTPQLLCKTLVKMRTGAKPLDTAVENAVLKVVSAQEYDEDHNTGANQTDMAQNRIYHACLVKNKNGLRSELDIMFSNLEYTEEEGLQHDYAFHQHGPQLYIGGYGEELLKTVTQTAFYTVGTEFSLSAEKVAVLSNFIRHAYFASIRGKIMAFDVLGRSVSRQGILDKSGSAVFADRMVSLDPENAQEYRDIANRLRQQQPASFAIKPGNRHFFRSDYTLHTRPDYTFDVRMVSTRTARCEKGNGENLKGYYLADGCTSIRVSGDEYFDIFPVWDWARVPGTTAPHSATIPENDKDWGVAGSSTFAGGVSDGTVGVSVYKYYDSKVLTGASKSWFQFDKEIVCLGAGINSDNPDAVNTTINQCHLADSKVVVSNNGSASETEGTSGIFTSPDWIIHNDIGYFLPSGGKLHVETGERSGTWFDINNTQKKDKVSAEVFTAYLDHGVKPSNAAYSYIIVPGISSVTEAESYASGNSVSVLRNNTSIQAVRSNTLGKTGIVFYNRGEFSCDLFDVTTNAPCVLLINDNGSFSIADPEEKEQTITVTLKMKNSGSGEKRIECDYSNAGIFAGQSKFFDASGNQSGSAIIGDDTAFNISALDGRIIIKNCADSKIVRIYDINGRLAYTGPPGVIEGLNRGFYFVNIEGETVKVAL